MGLWARQTQDNPSIIHSYQNLFSPFLHFFSDCVLVFLPCGCPEYIEDGACRATSTTPLQVGMVVSNEPGYYEDGAFGIRIENLLVTKEAETPFRYAGQSYLCFEPLTWCPIQRKMLALKVLPLALSMEDIAYWIACFILHRHSVL